MTRGRKVALASLLVPLGLLLAFLGAWALDRALGDDVPRGVRVAGTDVGGMSEEELRATVEELAERHARSVVAVRAEGFDEQAPAADLGLTVDVAATVDDVLEEGSEPWWQRPFAWAARAASPAEHDLELATDEELVAQAVAALEEGYRQPPTEPDLALTDAGFELVPGTPGRGIPPEAVVEGLPATASRPDERLVVEVRSTRTEPVVSDDEAQAVADEANLRTAAPLAVVVDGTEATVEPGQLRPLVTWSHDGEALSLGVDAEAVDALLTEAFPDYRTAAGADPTFSVQGDQVVLTPGTDGKVCCAEGSAEALWAATATEERRAELQVEVVSAQERLEAARQLGIVEKVGEFTTNHACCEPRVTNIHLMADAVRGVVIPPGESFSVNDHVGRRTTEKGYVDAPVIENGEFSSDVGGGVSQFATTLFNAAFFAGLDFDEYMSHSRYISRYPYGREATLAYPSVDLQIRNSTPHGVLVWTSYTDTSITVSLWSTRYAVGEQTGQNQSSGCGTVRTERTRTYVDGRTEVDEVRAWYRCEPPSS